MGAAFNIFGGRLYDNVAAYAPFTLGAVCDVSFAVLAILLALCGKLRDANPQDS